MGTRQIWPAKGDDKLVDVEDTAYAKITEIGKQFADMGTLYRPGDVWEIARLVILADREAREKTDRHARGDYGVELAKALEVATDIADETDGNAYGAVADLMSLLNTAVRTGFSGEDDVPVMLEQYNRLIEKLHATTENAVKLQDMLLQLKEVS